MRLRITPFRARNHVSTATGEAHVFFFLLLERRSTLRVGVYRSRGSEAVMPDPRDASGRSLPEPRKFQARGVSLLMVEKDNGSTTAPKDNIMLETAGVAFESTAAEAQNRAVPWESAVARCVAWGAPQLRL